MQMTKRKNRGFTLVELLVVIGIIALLISILLPALSKARKQANTVKCLANMKQFGTALVQYTNEWKGAMPYSGWNDFPGNGNYGGGKGNAGGWPDWLFDASSKITPPVASLFNFKDVKNGAFYAYLNGANAIYRCPQDAGPWLAQNSQFISSYVMNGSTNNFSYGVFYKVTAFHPGDAIMWEIGTTGPDGNDPSNTPNEPISARHVKGTSILFVDGHAEVWSVGRFDKELNRGPSPLWCVPQSVRKDGGFDGNTNHNTQYQE